MKTCWTLILLIVFFNLAKGQETSECSNRFYEDFRKVQLQESVRQISAKEAGRLRSAIIDRMDGCMTGRELPQYRLVSRSGGVYTNANLKGKVVFLNFSSANCGPCVLEIPVLNRIAASYKDNPDFVLLSVIPENEVQLDRMLAMGLTKRRIGYEVVTDARALFKTTFNFVYGYPTGLFLDREGRVVTKVVGAISRSEDEQKLEEKLRGIIEAVLANSAASK